MRTETSRHGGVSEIAKIQKELLWDEYAQMRDHMRHVEDVGTKVINFALILTSALVAVITLDKLINRADLPLCLVITGVGLITMAFSLLFIDRYGRQRARADCIRFELDRLFFWGKGFGKSLTALHNKGTSKALEKMDTGPRSRRYAFRSAAKIARGTTLFWVAVPALIFVTGLVLTSVAALT